MNKFLLCALLGIMCSAVAPGHVVATGALKGCKLKIGDTYAGGIVFSLDPGDDCHGLVCAPTDQAVSTGWKEARDLCTSLNTGGHSDWRLPSSDDLNEMYMNLYKAGLGNFTTQYYWSATEDFKGLAYAQYFCNANLSVYQSVYRYVRKDYPFCVRAVRAF